MTLGIIGENCSGKSTLADALAKKLGAEILTGKDYLRMAKSEAAAREQLRAKLKDAVDGGAVIYVITESDQLELLPEGAVRILVKADLETIRERFKARMHGVLPPPVAMMLERKHGCFDSVPVDFVYDGVVGDPETLYEQLTSRGAKEA